MSSKHVVLERFAAIAAEIEHGAAPPEVLSREGLDEAAWEEAQEEWMSKLAEETAEQESSDLNTRYQKAYGERLAALEKEARERPAPPPEPAEDEPAEDTVRSEPPPPPEPAPPPFEPAPPPPPVAPASPEPARSEARTLAFQVAPDSLRNPLPFQPVKNDPPAAAPPVSLRGAPRALSGGLPFQPAQPPSAGPPSQAVPNAQPVSLRPRNSPAPAADLETPRLTLDQWAQLSAEMAASPGAQAAVASRFGLDAFGVGHEQRAWARRFAIDRGLYDRFLALYQHYAAWIASRR